MNSKVDCLACDSPHLGLSHSRYCKPYGQHLPIFPCLDYAPITAERIERTVERLVDRADREYMNGRATAEQYDAWQRALTVWANDQYDRAGGRFGWSHL